MEYYMRIFKLNELNSSNLISPQTVLDILFDSGAKVVNAKHDKTQSEIVFEYNNQTATLYFFLKSKNIQIVHRDVILRSLYKVRNTDDLIRVLTDLLKRVF
jgi:hypothetical protein